MPCCIFKIIHLIWSHHSFCGTLTFWNRTRVMCSSGSTTNSKPELDWMNGIALSLLSTIYSNTYGLLSVPLHVDCIWIWFDKNWSSCDGVESFIYPSIIQPNTGIRPFCITDSSSKPKWLVFVIGAFEYHLRINIQWCCHVIACLVS